MRVPDFSYLSDESITGYIYVISNLTNIGEGRGVITFVTQILETIHVAELRKRGESPVFWKDLDTCTTKGTTKNQQSKQTSFLTKTEDVGLTRTCDNDILADFITGNSKRSRTA